MLLKSNKMLFLVSIFNFFGVSFVLYLSPRFDIFTIIGFFVVEVISFFLYKFFQDRSNRRIIRRIDEITEIIRKKKLDFVDLKNGDELGALFDEVLKILKESHEIYERERKTLLSIREYSEDIAHQIKTPLTGSILMLDLLEDDDKNREYIKSLRESMGRLLLLTDEMLKLSEIDSGVRLLEIKEVDGLKLLYEIKNEIKSYFKDADVIIKSENFTFLCDRKWTYEALFNLIKNAVTYTSGKVVIETEITNVYTAIRIVDFGSGMSEEKLKIAFKRFHKLDKNSSGYGIGLPLARTIIERENGELIYKKLSDMNYFEARFYKTSHLWVTFIFYIKCRR